MIIQPFPVRPQAVQPEAPVRVSVGAPGQTAPSQASPAGQPSPEELRSVVSAINLALQKSNRNLEFSIDTDANQTVIKLVDTSTGELIRQFPSEATLAISRGIEQAEQGFLLRQQA
ncbi:MAG: flagellar protein FlaG [Pseudomonadota bacterium]